METRKPLWDILSDERKRECVNRIIAYFQDERNEKIGVIAAQEILDTFVETAFPDIYNKGVLDAQKIIEEKSADMQFELDQLLRGKS